MSTSINKYFIYKLYFYTYWSGYIIEASLIFLTIQSMFKLAMEPLEGLQRLGLLIFRWAAGISMILAVATSITPGLTSNSFIIAAASQLQRSQSILTLCLLLFLCLAAQPLGLTYRSRLFGISLGFGVLATSDLVTSAWFSHNRILFSMMNLVHGVVILSSTLLWVGYFSLPEPTRKLITLPITSPLLRWNEIAKALGHSTPHVAVGKLGPEAFAEGELKMMQRSLPKQAKIAS
ncbi:MAG: hypothetical protein ACYC46_01735 [Acidobacteriaceae bacterium]